MREFLALFTYKINISSVQVTKGQAWFKKSKSEVLAYTAHTSKFSFSKNAEIQNLKFKFQNYFIFPPEKASFWFLKKNVVSSCFGSVSALKTINTQLLFVRYFSKNAPKKVINCQKCLFDHF